MRPLLPAVALMLTAAIFLGCRGEAPVAAAGARVENQTLALALASVPPPVEVATNEGEILELKAPGGAVATIAIGPPSRGGINLVEAVKARKAAFEALPGGRYSGNRELATPIGTAFTARGGFVEEGAEVEETWIYAIHPQGDRMLTMTYAYAPAEAETRVQELMALFGEIEGLVGSGAQVD